VGTHGTYKLRSRNRSFEDYQDPSVRSARRVSRIVRSLRREILEEAGDEPVRVRRIFERPREIFRLEFELPLLGYQRTTLLDREALDALLAEDDVRQRVRGTGF